MSQIMDFLIKALSEGMANMPSSRRLALAWFALLGGIAILVGLGFAGGILLDFEVASRVSLYATTLDFIYWVFATGLGVAGGVLGLTKIAGKKKGGDEDV